MQTYKTVTGAVQELKRRGTSDPGDEAVVYGIESNSGLKGSLINGYGYQSNSLSVAIARKLAIHR